MGAYREGGGKGRRTPAELAIVTARRTSRACVHGGYTSACRVSNAIRISFVGRSFLMRFFCS